MNRRDLIGTASLFSLAGIAPAALAAEPMAAGHDHHASGPPHRDLAIAASRCESAGDVCLSHCLVMLGQGDRELAACARTVRDTIAACSALRQLAAADSPHLKAFAKVVSGVCSDCATECQKHEKHAVCKQCEQVCRECQELCDKVASA